MDMLNQLQKLVSGDTEISEIEVQRQVQLAFPPQDNPTPVTLLLERLLAQAEATPQLAAFELNEVAETAPEETQPEAVAAVSTEGWWARLAKLAAQRRAAKEQPVYVALQRSATWDYYRERVEYHMRQVHSGSGVNPH